MNNTEVILIVAVCIASHYVGRLIGVNICKRHLNNKSNKNE